MYGVQRGFLTEYQTSVKNFMADCAEVGCDIDSPDFASIVLELKHNTRIAYQALKSFKNKISTSLLEIYTDELLTWKEKFYQQVCMQLQGTLMLNINALKKKNPELFHFTSRDVCRQVTYFTDDPKNMKHIDFGPMVICALYVLNRRLYSLLCSCIRILEHRTDDEVLQIYNQRLAEFRTNRGTMHTNLLHMTCNRLSKGSKLTMDQYDILFDSIFKQIENEKLRRIIMGFIDTPLALLKTLRDNSYPESVMEQVFSTYCQLEELKLFYEQKDAPPTLSYDEKMTAFLTACVKDIQSTSYSKDKGPLIRMYSEWFYVYRIFLENNVLVFSQCRDFVKAMQKLPIKVMKMPNDTNLYKVAQEFKERSYPDWVPPSGRAAGKYQRIIELGAVALKAYQTHKHLLN